MTRAILFSNPEGLHAPAGSYSHAVSIPPGARILVVSGQVGIRPDGTLGSTVLEQADQIFRNLGAVLRAHDLDFPDVVKLTTYMVAGQPGGDVRVARQAHMGAHRPAATFVYVSQLYAPEWLLEVEAIAARVG